MLLDHLNSINYPYSSQWKSKKSDRIPGCINDMHGIWVQDIRISQGNLHRMIPQLQIPLCKVRDCLVLKTSNIGY